MKSIQRRAVLQYGLGLAATSGLAGPAAWAQTAWPDKPIKFVLSQPAGAGPDIVARLIGDRLSRALGQAVVIENKPGGQNVIGAQFAARSAADGYTFYFATTAALVTNSFLFKTMPYDPQKDFVPVGFVARSPFAVLVKAESPIQSIQDLLDRSKAKPGTSSVGTEGPRTFGGIIARLLNARTQAGFNLASYASVGVAVQDAIGGHVDAALVDVAATAQLVRQGRLRMLAVTTGKRVPGWEQIPSLSELLPGFDMSGWFALVAPTGTPQPILEHMNREFNAALADPEVTTKITAMGPIVEAGLSLEQVGAFLKDEYQRWSQVSKEIGLLPE